MQVILSFLKYKTLDCLTRLIPLIISALVLSMPVMAEENISAREKSAKTTDSPMSFGVGIGALTIIGVDLRFFMREDRSPWVFGLRYVNTKDDFINEDLVGYPNDPSDKVFTRRVGVYADYLFSPLKNNSFYAGGGLYSVSRKLKCGSESDSDSNASLFIGGGYQGKWGQNFGYQLGILLSPFISSTLETTTCKSEESGDFDVNASLVLVF